MRSALVLTIKTVSTACNFISCNNIKKHSKVDIQVNKTNNCANPTQSFEITDIEQVSTAKLFQLLVGNIRFGDP